MARYQYETSPRKLEPDFIPNRTAKKSQDLQRERELKEKIKQEAKERAKQKRATVVLKKKVVVYIALIFAMLLVVSYRNSLITEDFNKVKSLKAELATLQKENQQTQVSIESNLNLSKIEEEAKSKLGMQKLDNSNKIYLDLQKKDYVEPASEEVILNDNSSWFEKLIKKLTQIIK